MSSIKKNSRQLYAFNLIDIGMITPASSTIAIINRQTPRRFVDAYEEAIDSSRSFYLHTFHAEGLLQHY